MSIRRTIWLGLLALVLAHGATRGAGSASRYCETAGWMRDGTADFSDENPPHTWNPETGDNILWRARLPNWSNGSPIVAGGRVYVMSEPFATGLPLLLCFDADSGEELWRQAVDWTRLLPEAEGAAARKQLSEFYAWSAEMLRQYAVFKRLGTRKSNRKMLPPAEPPQAVIAWNEAVDKARKLGWTGAFGVRAGGSLSLRVDHEHPTVKRLDAFVSKYAPVFPAWGPGLGTYRWSKGFYGESWEGLTFPTPVSDGEHVWMLTGHATVACFHRDGHLRWMRRFETRPRSSTLSGPMQQLAKRRGPGKLWPGPVPGGGDASTSPRLMDGKLILQAFKYIRALDPGTGKLLWEVPDCYPHGHSFGAPAYIEVSGTPAVVTGERGEVLRLADGKILGGPFFRSAPVYVRGNILIGRATRGARALRLSLAREEETPPGEAFERSDELWVEELWEAGSPVSMSRRPALSADRLYGDGWICDLHTGELIAGGKRGDLPDAGGGYHSPMRLLVKGCELSINASSGLFVFRDVDSHKVVGKVQMPKDPLGDANIEHVAARIGLSRWQWFGAGLPFAYRDRLYVRSHDYLYCVGTR